MNAGEQELYDNEISLVEAEKYFALYTNAPFTIIWASFIAILGLLPAYYSNNSNVGTYLCCFILIGIAGLVFYGIAQYRLNKYVVPTLTKLRIKKIKLENDLLKSRN